MTFERDSDDRGRLWIVLATVAINVAGVSCLTLAPWSDWRTGLALNLIDNTLLVGYALSAWMHSWDDSFSSAWSWDWRSYRLTPGWLSPPAPWITRWEAVP